jgi:hypothetical protein
MTALVFVQTGTVIAWQRKRFRDHWAKLSKHGRDLVSIDFFVVPTVRNKLLFVLVALAHHRRSVVHFNVTEYLGMDSPESRTVQSPALGKVVQLPEVGGLHHHYERLAA